MSQQPEEPEIRPARNEPELPQGEPDPDNPRQAAPAHTPGTEPAEPAPEPGQG